MRKEVDLIMSRYIDADKLRDEVDGTLNWETNNEYNMYSDIMDMIDYAPTADVQPVKYGRWMCGNSRYPYCSECRRTLITGIVTEYCPRCGAKMNKNGR